MTVATRLTQVLLGLTCALALAPVAEARAAPLSLSAVLAEALAHNEEAALGRARVARSKAEKRAALAGLLPQLSLSLLGRRNDEEVRLGERVVRQQYDWNAGARASMTLFDGTRYPLLGRAGTLLKATEAQAAWAQAELGFAVAQSFYTLAGARREVAIAAEAVSLRAQWLQRAEALLSSGVAIALDVARAHTQKLEAEQTRVEAMALAGDAADALATWMGRTTGEGLEIADGSPPEGVDAAQVGGQAPKSPDLRAERRPDLEAARLSIEAVRDEKDAVWWRALPRLELVGDASAGRASLSSPDGLQWSVSLAATWQVFDGGGRGAELTAIDARVQEQTLALRRAERQARSALRGALRSWQSAQAARAVAVQRVALASQVRDLAAARFEQGLASSVEVSDAAERHLIARLSESRTLTAVQVAAARWHLLRGVMRDGEQGGR